jgi:hypothetical protein
MSRPWRTCYCANGSWAKPTYAELSDERDAEKQSVQPGTLHREVLSGTDRDHRASRVRETLRRRLVPFPSPPVLYIGNLSETCAEYRDGMLAGMIPLTVVAGEMLLSNYYRSQISADVTDE